MSTLAQPRPLRVVLHEALQEIRERRRRLDTYQLKLDQEKATADTVIGNLEQLVRLVSNGNGDGPKPSTPMLPAPSNGASPKSPGAPAPGSLTKRIVVALDTSPEPLTLRQIAEHVGRDGRYLRTALTAGLHRGRWELVDGAYRCPTKADTGEEG